MQRKYVALYLSVPLFVAATVGIAADPEKWPVPANEIWLIMLNAIPLAIPQVAWLCIASAIKPSIYHWHGVFLAATVALLGVHISFECCVDNSNALGWGLYYKFAVFGMVLAYLGSTLYVTRFARQSSMVSREDL